MHRDDNNQEAHIVDLAVERRGLVVENWRVVNIPSRLTVTKTYTENADGSGGTLRFIFEGPPGAYAVKLASGDEEKTIEFTLDDTPMAAPGYIGAEMIKEDT